MLIWANCSRTLGFSIGWNHGLLWTGLAKNVKIRCKTAIMAKMGWSKESLQQKPRCRVRPGQTVMTDRRHSQSVTFIMSYQTWEQSQHLTIYTPLSTGLLYPKLGAQTSGIIQKLYETKTNTNTGWFKSVNWLFSEIKPKMWDFPRFCSFSAKNGLKCKMTFR